MNDGPISISCVNITTQLRQALVNGNKNFTYTLSTVPNPLNFVTASFFGGFSGLDVGRDPFNKYIFAEKEFSSYSYLNITYTSSSTPQLTLRQITPSNLSQTQNATQNQFFNVTTEVCCLNSNCGELNVSSSFNESIIISTTNATTPFYTIDQNPRNITLNQNECANVTWRVNATGNVGANYTFFVYANKTANMSISNITGNWNVTILNLTEYTSPIISNISVTFNYPSPSTNYNTSNSSFAINTSISGDSINKIKFNINSTNFSLIDNSLLIMYNFENNSLIGENSTKVADLSNYGSNLTLTLPIILNNSLHGKALFSNSSTALISAGNPSQLNSTFSELSMFAWVNPQSDVPSERIISKYWWKNSVDANKNSSFLMSLWNSDSSTVSCVFFINSTTGFSITNYKGQLNQTVWGHIGCTFNGTEIAIYTNGKLSSTKKISSTPLTIYRSDYPLTIGVGSNGTSWQNRFNGLIDDVRIYNKSLTPQEVNLIYSSNLQKLNSSLYILEINQTLNGRNNYTVCGVNSIDENCSNLFSLNLDNLPPKIRIDSPEKKTYLVTSIDYNLSLNEAGDSCYYVANSTKSGLANFWNFEDGAKDLVGKKDGKLSYVNISTGKFENGYYLPYNASPRGRIYFGSLDSDIYALSIWFNLDNTLNYTSSPKSLLSMTNYNNLSDIIFGSSTGLLTKEIIDLRYAINNSQQARVGWCGNGQISANSWHNLVVSWNGSLYNIFLDGERKDNCYYGNFSLFKRNYVWLGWSDTIPWGINGSVDDFAVYNQPLSLSDIVSINNSRVTALTKVNSTFFADLKSHGDGMNSLVVYCNDTFNNLGTNYTSFGVDTVPPAVSLSSPLSTSYFKNGSLVYFNYTSYATDGVDSCELWGNFNGSFLKNISKSASHGVANSFNLSLNDGSYIWNIRCNDTNGVSDFSAQGNQTFVVDSSHLLVNVKSPIARTYNFNLIDLEINTSKNAECLYAFDKIENKSFFVSELNYFADSYSLEDGSHSVEFFCNDSFGNENLTSISFTLNSLSQISITYPLDGINYSANVSYLEYSTSDIPIDVCWYSINNGTTNSSVESPSSIFDINALNGLNYWNIYCNDSYGNLYSARSGFNMSYHLPVLAYPKIYNLTASEITSSSSLISLDSDTEVYMEVNYGNTEFYTNNVGNLSGFFLSPSARLSSLSGGVVYTYQATICDRNDYCNSSSSSFTTLSSGCPSGQTRCSDGVCRDSCSTGESCFPAGTKILTANGEKNIEDVQVGEYVLSYNLLTNKKEISKVLEIENPVREHMCELNFGDSPLQLTKEHPVYTLEGWKSLSPVLTFLENKNLGVSELKLGDRVFFSNGEYKIINNISCWDEIIQTYNLKNVEKNNNFFANNILVHNKGGGPTNPICTNDCVLGQAEYACENSSSLSSRSCGNFDSDACLEFGSWQSTSCRVNQTCYSSSGITECRNINILTCTESWNCNWGACTKDGENYYSYATDCVDANSCGTLLNKPFRKACTPSSPVIIDGSDGGKCVQNISCGDWGKCSVVYSLKDVLASELKFLSGKQERICGDTKKCTKESYLEKRDCNVELSVATSVVEWCGEKYVEVRSKDTNKIVSRVKQSQMIGNSKIDVGMVVTDFSGYCSYCYDGDKDYDETGVDCGGLNCSMCEPAKKVFNWIRLIVIVLWLVVLAIILGIVYFYHKHRKEKRALMTRIHQFEHNLK